jgi:hypothetical protein
VKIGLRPLADVVPSWHCLSPWFSRTLGTAFPKQLASFAKRYSPGMVLMVWSPHYMEAAIPECIAEEIDKLAAK